MKLIGKTILIISPEPWGINHVSKHHYALELSKYNRVYFLNPPSSGNRLQKLNEKLVVIDYKPVMRGINRMPAQLRNYLNTGTIRKLEKVCQVKKFDITWSFDPFRFQNLKLFRSPLTIYHAVDVHSTSLEGETASTAHIAFTTCEIIREKILPDNHNVFNIGHGVSENFFKQRKITKRPQGKLKACMMGNLLRKLDFPVIFMLIENHPEVEFHFIGPHAPSNLSNRTDNAAEIEKLKSFPNTFLHGSVPQENLPDLLSSMDMFLILYRKDENPAALANPHKVLEYLASGKITLSYPLETNFGASDMIQFTSPGKIEKDFSDILRNIAVYNAEDRVNLRNQFAARNSYSEKVLEIQQRINETLYPKNKPLVSIITAVFNSESYIGSAIQSVLEQTYENWEHIIIDDGSTDDSAQSIKAYNDRRIKYHYQENQGVSSARNAGLDRMKGDFFCFLDADDYFPPESLNSRLKIFEKDPAINFVDGKIGIYDRYLARLKSSWEPSFRGNPLSELLSLSGSCFFGPSWMIRRIQSFKCQFHKGITHGEDLLFYLEAAHAGGLYDFTDEVILHYRKGHHSAMKNLFGLEYGYRYLYRQLWDMKIEESEIINFKKKTKNIIFRSYLGHLYPFQAIRSQLKKW